MWCQMNDTTIPADEYTVQDCADRIYALDKNSLTREEYLAKVQSIVLSGMCWSHTHPAPFAIECATVIKNMVERSLNPRLD